MLAAICVPPAAARIIVTERDEERGHIVVIDEVLATAERFTRLEDTSAGRCPRPRGAAARFEHAYLVAEVARERCETCAITILSMREGLLSDCLRQVLDFVEHRRAAQVVVISSLSYPKGLLEDDVPRSETLIARLLATGRVVIAVATVNTFNDEGFYAYPATSSQVVTVGSMAHHGLFGTKVDLVTAAYDVGFKQGNSFAAPQLALVARMVRARQRQAFGPGCVANHAQHDRSRLAPLCQAVRPPDQRTARPHRGPAPEPVGR